MKYRLLCLLMRTLSCIPFRALYLLSDLLYCLLFYIVRYRRKTAHRNICECFPEMSHADAERIEKSFYRFFADMLLESVKMCSISEDEMRRRMRFTNADTVNAVLDGGKSVSLFLGHYGNWEWVSSMPLWLTKKAIAAQIYHKLRDKDFNRLILYNRGRMGAVSVDMRKTARYVNELAIEHKVSIIGYIADQSPKMRESTHFLTFLHHKTPVLVGPEKITKHYGHEAWFVKVTRVGRGYYEAEFVKMHDNPKSLPDFELTEIYYRMLEQTIEEHPELYLWTHKRFKHAEKLNE